MKKIITTVVLLITAAALASCKTNLISDLNDSLTYPNADKYSSGNFTYQSEEISRVEVNWIAGSVEVTYEDGELSVSEDADGISDNERMRWYISDGMLSIQFTRSGLSLIEKSKKLSLEVPHEVELKINTTSADVSFTNEAKLKNAKINTVSGNITLGSVAADEFEADTTSGNLLADSISCSVFDCDTISGVTEIGELSADKLDFSSTSGNLTLNKLTCGDVKLSTVSGVVSLWECAADNIKFNSTSGNLNLSLASPTTADINTVSGDTHLTLNGHGAEFELSGVSADFITAVEHRQDGKKYFVGDGESRIKLNSTSGDMYVD